MQRIDKVVLKETKYIAVWVLIFSTLMQAVFLLIGRWDATVLMGNLYGASAAVLHYFGLGISVQQAMERDKKGGGQIMRASSAMRTLLLFLALMVGALLKYFNIWALILPLFFPRMAIAVRMWRSKSGQAEERAYER